jgi:hypothetical protein
MKTTKKSIQKFMNYWETTLKYRHTNQHLTSLKTSVISLTKEVFVLAPKTIDELLGRDLKTPENNIYNVFQLSVLTTKTLSNYKNTGLNIKKGPSAISYHFSKIAYRTLRIKPKLPPKGPFIPWKAGNPNYIFNYPNLTIYPSKMNLYPPNHTSQTPQRWATHRLASSA